jgi:hypothetical protein
MKNGDLKRELSILKGIQDEFEFEKQKMAVSKAFDSNVDYPFIIDVEDHSYFYATAEERDEDYSELCTFLNANTVFTYK